MGSLPARRLSLPWRSRAFTAESFRSYSSSWDWGCARLQPQASEAHHQGQQTARGATLHQLSACGAGFLALWWFCWFSRSGQAHRNDSKATPSAVPIEVAVTLPQQLLGAGKAADLPNRTSGRWSRQQGPRGRRVRRSAAAAPQGPG